MDGEKWRTVQIIYGDSKTNRAVRLRGAKRNKDGKILAMTTEQILLLYYEFHLFF